MADRTTGDRIIRGGVTVGVASVLVRFSGLIYSWVLIRAFGSGTFSDAHFFAFGVVIIVFNIVQQSVAPAFLPVFMGEMNRGDRRSAWRFASTVLVGVVALTGFVGALILVFPGFFTWFSSLLTGKRAPEAAGLLEAQVPLMAPAFVGISASVVTYMILVARKRFFLAQAAEGVMRFVGVGAILVVVGLGMAGGAAAKGILTADFDLRPYRAEHSRDESAAGYYFRDQKSVVTRIPEAFGGRGVYVEGNQRETFVLLYREIIGRL